MKNNKTVTWLIVIIIIVAALMLWGRRGFEASAGTWEDTVVLCLPSGHANLGQHIHPNLEIAVNGEQEEIPTNIGVASDCMAEVHTHDGTGEIHLETVSPGKDMTLGNFFEVWDQPIEREGFETTVTVNGEVVTEPASLVLRDRDQIGIEYTSIEDDDQTAEQL